MALRIAYDKTTGAATRRPVPTHWVGHPKLGPNLTLDRPTAPAVPTPTTEADESANNEEE